MKELNTNFQYDGMPLKTGNWLDSLVVDERGNCGIVTNQNFSDLPEVEVAWFEPYNGKLNAKTNLIDIKPFSIYMSDADNEYKCSVKMVEWLHKYNAMFSFKLKSDFIKIEAGIVYPA